MAIKFLNTVQVDTDVLYVNTTNNNVGIGTDNPLSTLHVAGPSTLATQGTVLKIENTADQGSSQDIHIYNQYDRDVGIKFETLGGINYIWQDSNSDDALILSSGGTNRENDATLIIHQSHNVFVPNGKVGIGTTSADHLLTLQSSGDTILQINRKDDTIAGGNRTGIIQFGARGSWGTNLQTSKIWSYAEETFTSTANGTSLRFFTTELGAATPTEKMIIDTNGHVGIGTDSPGLKLDINSGTANSALRVLSTDRYTGIKFEDSLDNDTLFYDGQDNLMYLGTTNFRAVDLHAAGNLRVEGAYYDSNNSPGTANQVLVSTVTGTDWVDGSGSSIIGGPYLPLVGNTTATAMTGDIFLANQQQVRFLTSANAIGLRLQSSNDNSFIDNEVGDMYIRQEADNNDMIFQADDGLGGNATYFFLDGSEADGTGNLYTNFPDKSRLTFGNDDPNGDLQIYHDPSHSYITNITGDLTIDSQGDDLILKSADDLIVYVQGTEIAIQAIGDAGVQLRYNNSNRFETTSNGVAVIGDIKIDSALLNNQENTDIDTGTEVVAQVSTSLYTAAFFDFVIKKVGNIRSGTVYACHDGTNVEFTETSTQDLGDTSDVVLSVDISGGNMRLMATVASDDWSVKSLIKAI